MAPYAHARAPKKLNNLLVFLLQLLSLTPQTTSEETTSPPFRPYRLLNSEEIHSTLLKWKTDYPDLVEVHTAQETFGLATAGNNVNNDCPFDTNVKGCLNYYAVLTDKVAHPPDSQSWRRLPTVLLSGELHGNERVGPTTVMETARLLLEAATCEALPLFSIQSRTNATLHAEQLQQAQQQSQQ